MKFILLLIVSFVSVFTFAATDVGDVKITSFRYLSSGVNRSPVAELCGQLLIPTNKPELVKVIVDPSGKAPGYYFAWAGPDGKFCLVVATFTGNAEAELQK